MGAVGHGAAMREPEPVGQDARQVSGEPAAGHVAHGADVDAGEHRLDVPRVEARRREQRFAHRLALQLGGAIVTASFMRSKRTSRASE